MVVIGATVGISRITKEHMDLVNNLKLPMIVVLTKSDIASKDILQKNIKEIKKFSKQNRVFPFIVKTENDILQNISRVA
jgi:GTPase